MICQATTRQTQHLRLRPTILRLLSKNVWRLLRFATSPRWLLRIRCTSHVVAGAHRRHNIIATIALLLRDMTNIACHSSLAVVSSVSSRTTPRTRCALVPKVCQIRFPFLQKPNQSFPPPLLCTCADESFQPPSTSLQFSST